MAIVKKVLHCTMMSKPMIGIISQMRWEEMSARKHSLSWDVKIYSAEELQWNGGCERGKKIRLRFFSFLEKIINWFLLRVSYYRWLAKKSNYYDLLLVRYMSYDIFQWIISRRLKSKICFIHHTLEVPELSLENGWVGKLKKQFEEFIGKKTLGNARAIIGVTNEILTYELNRSLVKPTYGFTYPNGIQFKSLNKEDNPRYEDEMFNLVFISSYFYPWQGLDLLLLDIKNCSKKFTLNLVGDMSAKDMELAKSDPRVVIHGVLNNKSITTLVKKCAVGISSLALWRKGMCEAAPLKTREYLAAGTAVYASYQDVFPDTFEFFRCGPVSIEKILSFSRLVVNSTRQDVSIASCPYIDKETLLKSLYFDSLSTVINSKNL